MLFLGFSAIISSFTLKKNFCYVFCPQKTELQCHHYKGSKVFLSGAVIWHYKFWIWFMLTYPFVFRLFNILKMIFANTSAKYTQVNRNWNIKKRMSQFTKIKFIMDLLWEIPILFFALTIKQIYTTMNKSYLTYSFNEKVTCGWQKALFCVCDIFLK